MIVCDCFTKGHKGCVCGAFKDGVLVDKATVRVPLFLADGARTQRKEPHMMTDAEIRDMKTSVRGMPLSQAKDLPIYNEFKGLFTDGMPANELRALYDGAVADSVRSADEVSRVEAHRDHMIDMMRNEHQRAVNDNDPQNTRTQL
jgi:hypothetical protein